MRRTPEERIAGKLVQRFNLKPPINLQELISHYNIQLVYDDIPKNIDGLSLYIKSLTRNPLIIINQQKHPLRQRFTLAHEIGHVLIPWHTGSFIDIDDFVSQDFLEAEYKTFEGQANKFASELLMPKEWLEPYLDQALLTDTLAKINEDISILCNVSLQAVALKMIRHLPRRRLFIVVRNGRIEGWGHSGYLYGHYFKKNQLLPNPEKLFLGLAKYSYTTISSGLIAWYDFSKSYDLSALETSNHTWREMLDEIMRDIDDGQLDIPKFKRSINGIIAAANSSLLKSRHYGKSSLFEHAIESFKDRDAPHYHSFISHRLFKEFLYARIVDLCAGREVRNPS